MKNLRKCQPSCLALPLVEYDERFWVTRNCVQHQFGIRLNLRDPHALTLHRSLKEIDEWLEDACDDDCC